MSAFHRATIVPNYSKWYHRYYIISRSLPVNRHDSPQPRLTRKTAIDRFKLIHICQFAMRLESDRAVLAICKYPVGFIPRNDDPFHLRSINRFFLFSIRMRTKTL